MIASWGPSDASNPASPVARINLPGTCGSCHSGPFTAFQKSRHYELVRSGNREAPTCATCHDEVGAHLLSPKQLEGRCASCHEAGRVAPNTDRAPEGRLMLEGIRDARALLKEANAFIAKVSDKTSGPMRIAGTAYSERHCEQDMAMARQPTCPAAENFNSAAPSSHF